jgi:sugar lactone lactonase YvrE
MMRRVSALALAVMLAAALAACGASSHPAKPLAAVRITTLAGRAWVQGSSDGPGSEARFKSPYGIACDAAGNVYIADSGNYTVRKITPGGLVTTLAGEPGSRGYRDGLGASARFYNPQGIACDASGDAFVVDGRAIRKITPAGLVSTVAGTAGIPSPTVDSAALWLGSAWGRHDGLGTKARFWNPSAVAVDAKGKLYVTDNGLLRTITPAGVVSTPRLKDQTPSIWSDWQNLCCDARGDLFLTSRIERPFVEEVTSQGVIKFVAGSQVGNQGNQDGSGKTVGFYQPVGIACDAQSDLFVADYGTATIRVITPDDNVATLAGASGQAGSVDGNASTARLDSPCGLAYDAKGHLYVACGDGTIREILLSRSGQ